MERSRPRSSSRDKAEGLSKNEGGLEKGQAVTSGLKKGEADASGLEKGQKATSGLKKGQADASGLEQGHETRGGPYRKPCLDMKEEELTKVFDHIVTKHAAKAFDFGDYNSLQVAQAASAKGLVECQHWLRGLLPVCDGTPKGNPLKMQILRFTHYNGTDMKHQLWASSLSSKILTIVNHWRRLKSNPERRRQALQKAGPKDAQTLLELLQLEPGHGEAWNNANEACKKVKKELEEPTREPRGGEDEACDKATDMEVDKSWVQDGDDASSEVSMDSKGYPMMLKTPDGSQERSGLASASSGLKQGQSPPSALKGSRSPKTPKARGLKQGHPSPKSAGARGLKQGQPPQIVKLPFISKRAKSHREALQKQAAEAAEKLATKSPPTKERKNETPHEVKKKPAMGKKLAKRPATSMAEQGLETRPAMKRPASQVASVQELGSEIRPGFSGWLKVKAESYTKQGYIKGWFGEAWTLLVACSEKQAANYPGGHGAVIDALLPHCRTEGMTKAKLVELRNEMLAQHKS